MKNNCDTVVRLHLMINDGVATPSERLIDSSLTNGKGAHMQVDATYNCREFFKPHRLQVYIIDGVLLIMNYGTPKKAMTLVPDAKYVAEQIEAYAQKYFNTECKLEYKEKVETFMEMIKSKKA